MPSVSMSTESALRAPTTAHHKSSCLATDSGMWLIFAQMVARSGAQKKRPMTWVHIFLDPSLIGVLGT